jgi:hypothetical protein
VRLATAVRASESGLGDGVEQVGDAAGGGQGGGVVGQGMAGGLQLGAQFCGSGPGVFVVERAGAGGSVRFPVGQGGVPAGEQGGGSRS